MIQGYDVSNVNGLITIPVDAEFVIAKVSQDITFVDRIFPIFRKVAREREIGFGGYHYADNNAQPDPIKSCNFFLQHLGKQEDGEIGALDVEGDYGWGGFYPNNPNNTSWVVSWGQEFTRQLGYKPKLYTSVAGLKDYGLDHAEIADLYELWLAYWTTNPQPPAPPSPFTEFKLWQYNADHIDKNKFLGTLDEFRAGGKITTPVEAHEYEAKYWTPMYDIISNMQSNSKYPHADAAFHANIANAITLHKVALDVEANTQHDKYTTAHRGK